ncbi:hypothetical protein MOQ72_11940 [Saccharopolyspora sp. K220]|uniref:hypothetical protein n=1 Tax=Saccharopolyspora soli TaxID=2926618 RepID=UPI001F57F4C2|nr:hypothetical protein [Saccharopolyspora soli]MCI2418139.1 hypothetical protein [Saccharopolyspora soli]
MEFGQPGINKQNRLCKGLKPGNTSVSEAAKRVLLSRIRVLKLRRSMRGLNSLIPATCDELLPWNSSSWTALPD